MDLHACLLGSPDHEGWLIDGQFWPSDESGFPSVDLLPAQAKEIEDLHAHLRGLQQEEESSQDRSDRGEHPEWHHYEIAQSAFREDQEQLRHVLFAHNAVWLRLEYGRAKATGRPQALASWDLTGFKVEEIADKALRAYLPKIPVDPLLGPDAQGMFLNAQQEQAWGLAIANLREKGYGWVSPDRQVLVCGLHEHFKVVQDAGAEPTLFDALERALDEKDFHKKHQMQHDVREDDHRIQTLKNQIVALLYQAGWIRLAVFQERLNAEGRKKTIKPVARMLTTLAQDAHYTFVPRYV